MDWTRHVASRDPRALSGGLVAGDPLRLRLLCGERAVDRALLVDLEDAQRRLVERLCWTLSGRMGDAGRGAGEAVLSGPMPGDARGAESWLRACVDGVLDELLGAVEGSDRDAFALMGRPLGVEPAAFRRGCARFNRGPEVERRAYMALVRDDLTLEQAAVHEGCAPLELAARARRALERLVGRGESDD